jgi:hypothetical protein
VWAGAVPGHQPVGEERLHSESVSPTSSNPASRQTAFDPALATPGNAGSQRWRSSSLAADNRLHGGGPNAAVGSTIGGRPIWGGGQARSAVAYQLVVGGLQTVVYGRAWGCEPVRGQVDLSKLGHEFRPQGGAALGEHLDPDAELVGRG